MILSADRLLRLRTRVLYLLKEEDATPEEGVVALLSVAVAVAVTSIGRWRLLSSVWRLYGLEKKRLHSTRVKQLVDGR